jgi:hypothetical protein
VIEDNKKEKLNFVDDSMKKNIDGLISHKKRYREVKCNEIEGDTNIAHRICNLKMKNYLGIKDERCTLTSEDFFKYYQNPELCKIRIPAAI